MALWFASFLSSLNHKRNPKLPQEWNLIHHQKFGEIFQIPQNFLDLFGTSFMAWKPFQHLWGGWFSRFKATNFLEGIYIRWDRGGWYLMAWFIDILQQIWGWNLDEFLNLQWMREITYGGIGQWIWKKWMFFSQNDAKCRLETWHLNVEQEDLHSGFLGIWNKNCTNVWKANGDMIATLCSWP